MSAARRRRPLSAYLAPPRDSAQGSAPSAVEREVHRQTNIARAKHGRRPLQWDSRLAAAAQAHSDDMERRNYLGHDTKGGGPWFALLYKHGVSRKRALGQNVADRFDADEVHELMLAWMASPLHRQNILARKFHRIGIGRSGDSWTVNFSS